MAKWLGVSPLREMSAGQGPSWDARGLLDSLSWYDHLTPFLHVAEPIGNVTELREIRKIMATSLRFLLGSCQRGNIHQFP